MPGYQRRRTFFRKKRVRYNHIKRTFVYKIPNASTTPLNIKLYQPESAPVKITGVLIKHMMNLELENKATFEYNKVFTAKTDLIKVPEGVQATSLWKKIPKLNSTDQTYGNEKNLLISDMGQLYITGSANSITNIRTWNSRLNLSSKRNLDEKDSINIIITPPSDLSLNQDNPIFVPCYGIIEFTTFSTVNV